MDLIRNGGPLQRVWSGWDHEPSARNLMGFVLKHGFETEGALPPEEQQTHDHHQVEEGSLHFL
jgi:hypothetical protein